MEIDAVQCTDLVANIVTCLHLCPGQPDRHEHLLLHARHHYESSSQKGFGEFDLHPQAAVHLQLVVVSLT